MFNRLLLTCVLLFCALYSMAQKPADKGSAAVGRINLLLDEANKLLFRPGEDTRTLDSALLVAGEALRQSQQLTYARGVVNARYTMGTVYGEKRDYAAAEQMASYLPDSLHTRLIFQLFRYIQNFPDKPQGYQETSVRYIQQVIPSAIRSQQTGYLKIAAAFMSDRYYEQHAIDKLAAFNYATFQSCREAGFLDGQVTLYSQLAETYYYKKRAIKIRPVLQTMRRELINDFNTLKRPDAKIANRFIILAANTGAYFFALEGATVALEEFEPLLVIQRKLQPESTIMQSWLTKIYVYTGQLPKALPNALDMVKLADKGDDSKKTVIAYSGLGECYYYMGQFDKSIAAYKKALLASEGEKGTSFLPLVFILRMYSMTNRPAEGLRLAAQYGQLLSETEKAQLAHYQGDCFFTLGQYDSAQVYFRRALADPQETNDRFTRITNLLVQGEMYFSSGEMEKGAPYMQALLADSNRNIVPMSNRRAAHMLLFRADSAKGDYLSAIAHLQAYKQLDDSLFNAEKNRVTEEMNVRFETEKKDHNIEQLTTQSRLQLAELQASLLSRRYEQEKKKREMDSLDYIAAQLRFTAETKDRDILDKKQRILLQEADLRDSNTWRNILIGGAVMLALLLLLLYNRYIIRQKSNRLLQAQQQLLNASNTELKTLTGQQQKLLQEKEWLVKEIHHRVKNNLQIVISLLNAQSDFLDHPSALHAIQESRERMQAIAIIHQKLYQQQGSTLINMQVYTEEMVAYLRDSFSQSGRIFFDLQVADIDLDISQVVPLGLIMNEAITNAVKYAFGQHDQGTIRISLQQTGDDILTLRISDNGRGMPAGLDTDNPGSLGMQLIQLFAEQLEGELRVITDGGVHISLAFQPYYADNYVKEAVVSNTIS